MQTLLTLLTVLLVPLSAVADKPNVILIMADDLAYNDLSCYGSIRQKTPHLDKMASEGIRFTSFYSGNTVCTPSRMALLTGAYPPRVGWRGGVGGYGVKAANGLSPAAFTIAELFKTAGYKTAISGKWHIGEHESMLPMNQGFDSSYYIRKSNNQTKKLFRDGKLIEDPFKNPLLSEQFTVETIRLIKENKGGPFFIYLPYTAPHFPAQSHPDWKGKSSNEAFGDVVEEMDFRVGEIFKSLKDNGLDEKTIVIFMSDNGTEGGQKKWSEVKPFRGGKWTSMEGGSRVPCIIRYPKTVSPGQINGSLINAVDILPTLAGACGIELKMPTGSQKIDGHNLWESILGKAEHPRKSMLYWHGWGVPQAVRVGDFKLYVDIVKEISGSDKKPVLINLKEDPVEKTDLSQKYPEKVLEMKALAKKLLKDIKENSLPMGGPALKKGKEKKAAWLNL